MEWVVIPFPRSSSKNKAKRKEEEEKIDQVMLIFSYIQSSSVAQSYLTLLDPMAHSTPGLPVHHQLLEPTQTHLH